MKKIMTGCLAIVFLAMQSCVVYTKPRPHRHKKVIIVGEIPSQEANPAAMAGIESAVVISY